MEHLNCRICLGLLAVMLTAGAGCAPSKTSWHEKFQWQAEDYFKDQRVVRLCAAIEADDLAGIDEAVKAGADVNARGEGNMTPLLWAFPDDRPERFKRLLELGADPNVIVESDFNTRNVGIQPGDSVTLLAAKSAFERHFELVMANGGDANYVNPKTKESLLQIVIQGPDTNKRARIQTLIANGVNLDHPTRSGAPPLIEAFTWLSQYDVVIDLLEAGADPGVYHESQNTKLVHMVIWEQSQLAKRTPQQKQDYDTIVRLLKEKGESFDDAEADIKRWASWSSLPRAKRKELREAETASRQAEPN